MPLSDEELLSQELEQSVLQDESADTDPFDSSLRTDEELLEDVGDEEAFDNSLSGWLYPPANQNYGTGAKNSDTFSLSGVVYVGTVETVVAGNAGATALDSFTFEPNSWHANMVVRVRAFGYYTTDDATANVALALKVGSTTYHTITTTGATIPNAPWNIEWIVRVKTIGATGTVATGAEAKTNNVNKDSANTGSPTLDTTTTQVFSILATWASGDAADSITLRGFIIEVLN